MVDEPAPYSDCENFFFVKSKDFSFRVGGLILFKARCFLCVLALSGTVYGMYTTLALEKLTLIPDTFKYSRNSFYFQNIN